MQDLKNDSAKREIHITRLLQAPIELVWEVWTDPEHIKNWWGPSGFTSTINKMDVQPGGEWLLVLHGPDGANYKNENIFREVVKHKKLVYDHVSFPKFTATIEFENRGNTTFLSWRMVFDDEKDYRIAIEIHQAHKGLQQNVEKLDAYLQQDHS